MRHRLGRVVALLACGVLLPVAANQPNLIHSIVNAPVTPNGDVSGQTVDFVINLNVHPNPNVPGLSLRRGRSIRSPLPGTGCRGRAPTFLS